MTQLCEFFYTYEIKSNAQEPWGYNTFMLFMLELVGQGIGHINVAELIRDLQKPSACCMQTTQSNLQ